MPKFATWALNNQQTFAGMVGDVDHAFEYLVLDAPWAFWQYSTAADCADVPKTTASGDEILAWFDTVNGFGGYTDQGITPYVPYYYQAGTQLGSPDVKTPHLAGLLRYPGTNGPRSYVPRSLPMRFQPLTMLEIDAWVKLAGRKLLFVYGQNDPWGAEPFRLGPGTRDSLWYQAAGANHGANIGRLTAAEQLKAKAAVQRWAGVPAARRRTRDHPRPVAGQLEPRAGAPPALTRVANLPVRASDVHLWSARRFSPPHSP